MVLMFSTIQPQRDANPSYRLPHRRPSIRKRSRTGIPNFPENLLKNMQVTTIAENIRRYSAISIAYHYRFCFESSPIFTLGFKRFKIRSGMLTNRTDEVCRKYFALVYVATYCTDPALLFRTLRCRLYVFMVVCVSC